MIEIGRPGRWARCLIRRTPCPAASVSPWDTLRGSSVIELRQLLVPRAVIPSTALNHNLTQLVDMSDTLRRARRPTLCLGAVLPWLCYLGITTARNTGEPGGAAEACLAKNDAVSPGAAPLRGWDVEGRENGGTACIVTISRASEVKWTRRSELENNLSCGEPFSTGTGAAQPSLATFPPFPVTTTTASTSPEGEQDQKADLRQHQAAAESPLPIPENPFVTIS